MTITLTLYKIQVVENQLFNVADTTDLEDDRDIVKLILETYKNHPSILAIIEHRGFVSEYCSFNEVTSKEVREIVKSLDYRKSMGEDMIPPKLVSLSADELTVPLKAGLHDHIYVKFASHFLCDHRM